MTATTDLRDADAVTSLFEQAATALRDSPWRDRSVERLPANGRLLVTGDLHDNGLNLDGVLKAAGLDRGTDRHVLLQELIHGENLINGLDFSHRMLARIAELVLCLPGQVHPILANHELAQLTDRAVSKGGHDSVELFDGALEYVFSERWEDVAAAIDSFIRAMPIALIAASGLLCAHSLPSARSMDRFDATLLEREIADEDLRGPDGAAYMMVWGRHYTSESVAALAERWGVRLFCLGHQKVEAGIEAFGTSALLINSDHAHGRVLPVDLAALPTIEEALFSAMPLVGLV